MNNGTHDHQPLHANGRLRDSRNFWKWLALVSWISVALLGALQIFPLH